MINRRWVLAACLTLGVGLAGIAVAEEPDTDCHKVKEWSDMMVCGNPNLTDLNMKVNKAYRKSQEGLPPEDAGKVTRVQEAWLKGREKCQESDDPTKCLEDYYQRRIKGIVQPNE